EVSTDDGATWTDAELGPEPEPNAWREWTLPWDAAPGVHVVRCRATDASGATQPLDPPWNVGGYANNTVQRTTVTVAAGLPLRSRGSRGAARARSHGRRS